VSGELAPRKPDERAAQNERAQSLRTQQNDGLWNCKNSPPMTAESQVRETENLRTEARIGANDFRHFVEIHGGITEQGIQPDDVAWKHWKAV
jgi:hypothetical protein